ncbi:uroporphyrinogen-III synthase [Knoellia remsis]|uniref:Uroporphyrinogen-III synthase n=1 Tax=Knoellia remsis TaxID=407159 RepID=A0A2T0UZ48_9MICO|nr:uroporphyrinogen-III synthase [Knoellia remsis]PRY63191.1 uroporphyrinogen-III synthase [Knoellia remsis]
MSVERTPPGLSQVLTGCVVLVTADRRSEELSSALARRGATVRHAPALTIVPHEHDEDLLLATKQLLAAPPDVVVVTTGIGLRGWVEAADAAGLADELVAVLSRARLIARGPKARGAIQAAGLTADWVAESETSAEILELLLGEGVSGQRIAVQHHGAGADGLDTELAAAGADVQSLVVYRWGPPPDPDALVGSVRETAVGEVDAVVFTSAPGAHAWLAAAESAGVLDAVVERTAAGSLVVAAVGPVTAAPLQDKGIRPLVPDRSRLGALVRTLVHHFEESQSAALHTPVGLLQVRRTVALLDGHVLPLSPSGAAVLRLLVAADGDVVSRAQVLEVLPGDSVDPHAAEVAVARLREVAGRELVETVVKRGYRLARR